MKKESLFESNPYLHDNESYPEQLVANVASSTAIEVGTLKPSLRRELVLRAKSKRPAVKASSGRRSL